MKYWELFHTSHIISFFGELGGFTKFIKDELDLAIII
jgi:hypothetical protein